MWEENLPIDFTDLLQGRIQGSAFLKHYWRPQLEKKLALVRSMVEKEEKNGRI